MNDDLKWHLLQSKMKRHRASELLSALEQRGIQAVLIKGTAVERFYPEDVPRPAFDIDIAVEPRMYGTVMGLFESGALGSQDADVHEGLRHFDTREWGEIYGKSKVINIEGSNIRVLSEEDQLRVTCIHWLADGGERKDRLKDIHYLVANRPPEFNWNYALNADGPVRRGWIASAIGIACKYTDLEAGSLPFADEASHLPAWLIVALEKRWNDDVKFMPLDIYLKDPVNFARQLKRRIPPNPIMSTIMTEGKLDSGSRIKYQMMYFFQRAFPSLKRSFQTFLNIMKAPKDE